ncbi:hypothetical protein ABID47_005429 [Paenibacillus favisporus]|uniref:Uncharacterized protein n=1 Tax=Paenibacillus favisporus TaxID=221028 RepID=A0ABV2FAL0_9BACL
MSILRLESAANTPIDCRYIQSLDLEISNQGIEPFEMLIHGYGEKGLFHLGLIHVGAGQTVAVPDIVTNHSPFQIVLVTNINSFAHTGVIFRVKYQGMLIAVYTQEDTVRTP